MTEYAACPESSCQLPASIEERGLVDSTHGPVRIVKLHCPAGHWFAGAADTLLREGS
jgi:hypothetical protein